MINMDQVKCPVALLSELSDDKVPDYLYPLVIAARMLGNFAVYSDPVSNRARALRIIADVKRELECAEQRCRECKCEDIIRFDDWNFVCIFDMGHAGPHRDEIEYEGKSVVVEWRREKNGEK